MYSNWKKNFVYENKEDCLLFEIDDREMKKENR